MLKKIGLPVIALLGLLSFAPHQAKAAVRVGVYAGAPAVVYTAPVCARPVVIPARPVVVYGHPWIRHEIRRDLRFRR
ncbi:MAG TPA: hypothetical protein VMI94_27920 [Bryobacteraceae bacterium]|nr:hypothetical protein [Bryobacteraceae bacterium]